MQYNQIGNCGELGIEFENVEGFGEIVTKFFLTRLLENTVKRATKYFDETNGDQVFSYREKQLHSVICPSIAEITHSYMVEHPLTRKPVDEEEYSGNVDYWVSYKKMSFFIELKHAFFAYSQEVPRKSIATRFNRAVRQLKDIRQDECKNLCEGDKGFSKIALEGITFYKGNSDKDKLSVERSELIEAFQRLRKSPPLNKANMYALWLVNKRMQEPFEYSNGNEIYPAVAFIAKIY